MTRVPSVSSLPNMNPQHSSGKVFTASSIMSSRIWGSIRIISIYFLDDFTVFIRVIGQNGDKDALVQPLRYLQGAGQVGGGRRAQQQSFVPPGRPDHLIGFFGTDLIVGVRDRRIV